MCVHSKDLLEKQEAHGPHRSPEKTVQINKHIFTFLTHISFPASQTTSVTVTYDFVAYPRISTSQAAILRTIISKQADTTLYQMKFTIAVSSRVDKKKDVYLMRIASYHNVFIFILKNTFITYVYV